MFFLIRVLRYNNYVMLLRNTRFLIFRCQNVNPTWIFFGGSRIVEKFRKYFKRNFGKLKNEKIVDDLDFEINLGAYQYDTKVGPTSFGSF